MPTLSRTVRSYLLGGSCRNMPTSPKKQTNKKDKTSYKIHKTSENNKLHKSNLPPCPDTEKKNLILENRSLGVGARDDDGYEQAVCDVSRPGVSLRRSSTINRRCSISTTTSTVSCSSFSTVSSSNRAGPEEFPSVLVVPMSVPQRRPSMATTNTNDVTNVTKHEFCTAQPPPCLNTGAKVCTSPHRRSSPRTLVEVVADVEESETLELANERTGQCTETASNRPERKETTSTSTCVTDTDGKAATLAKLFMVPNSASMVYRTDDNDERDGEEERVPQFCFTALEDDDEDSTSGTSTSEEKQQHLEEEDTKSIKNMCAEKDEDCNVSLASANSRTSTWSNVGAMPIMTPTTTTGRCFSSSSLAETTRKPELNSSKDEDYQDDDGDDDDDASLGCASTSSLWSLRHSCLQQQHPAVSRQTSRHDEKEGVLKPHVVFMRDEDDSSVSSQDSFSAPCNKGSNKDDAWLDFSTSLLNG